MQQNNRSTPKKTTSDGTSCNWLWRMILSQLPPLQHKLWLGLTEVCSFRAGWRQAHWSRGTEGEASLSGWRTSYGLQHTDSPAVLHDPSNCLSPLKLDSCEEYNSSAPESRENKYASSWHESGRAWRVKAPVTCGGYSRVCGKSRQVEKNKGEDALSKFFGDKEKREE